MLEGMRVTDDFRFNDKRLAVDFTKVSAVSNTESLPERGKTEIKKRSWQICVKYKTRWEASRREEK